MRTFAAAASSPWASWATHPKQVKLIRAICVKLAPEVIPN